jgi:hypothetical protein
VGIFKILVAVTGWYFVYVCIHDVVYLTFSLFAFLNVFVQFIVPREGIQAGQSFGYGASSPFNSQWEAVEGTVFDLGINGDQLLVYCLNADDKPHFLWGFSYNGNWSEPGLADYGTNTSALPEALQTLGHTILPHKDNCLYNGTQSGRKTDLQAAFMNASNYDCSDEARFEIADPQSGASSWTSMTTTTVVAMMSLLTMWGWL